MSAHFVPVDLARVASVLDDLGGRIELLGGELCADPALVGSHIGRLQDIDRIAQYLHAIGDLLRAECTASAVRQVGLDELIDQLMAE